MKLTKDGIVTGNSERFDDDERDIWSRVQIMEIVVARKKVLEKCDHVQVSRSGRRIFPGI